MLSEYNWSVTTKDPNTTWNFGEYQWLNEGSGEATFSRDSSQTSLVYFCEYDYHKQFLDVVLGKSVKDGGTIRRSASNPNFGGTNGSLPEPHPYYSNFYAYSAELMPRGVPSNNAIGPQWKKAKIHVVFRPPNYNIIPDGVLSSTDEMDRFTIKIPEGSAEFQTTQGSFKFVDDANPNNRRVLDVRPGFIVSARRYTYTWVQIPVATTSAGYPDLGRPPNESTVLDLVGKINSVTFDGFAPGTVLFAAPGTSKLVLPQVASSNNYYWDISYILAVRDYGVSSTPLQAGEHVGWNYAYSPKDYAWRLYTNDGKTTGKPMYQYADLNQLFQVTW